eukprot:4109159-Prymnesium_polylepis.1
MNTVCFGTAASMGAFLLGAGTKGKRRSLPNSRIMIHQPLGGAQGQAADIEIQAKEILFIRGAPPAPQPGIPPPCPSSELRSYLLPRRRCSCPAPIARASARARS